MLTQAVGIHWHALVRDVLALGYRTRDMFTALSFADMLAIVVAAPPASSLRWYLDGGWSRTDHLLANQQEQRANMASLQKPYERPGADAAGAVAGSGMFPADVMTWEEADRRDAQRGRVTAPAGKTHSRTWGARGPK